MGEFFLVKKYFDRSADPFDPYSLEYIICPSAYTVDNKDDESVMIFPTQCLRTLKRLISVHIVMNEKLPNA
jgi:hypothetical protein